MPYNKILFPPPHSLALPGVALEDPDIIELSWLFLEPLCTFYCTNLLSLIISGIFQCCNPLGFSTWSHLLCEYVLHTVKGLKNPGVQYSQRPTNIVFSMLPCQPWA